MQNTYQLSEWLKLRRWAQWQTLHHDDNLWIHLYIWNVVAQLETCSFMQFSESKTIKQDLVDLRCRAKWHKILWYNRYGCKPYHDINRFHGVEGKGGSFSLPPPHFSCYILAKTRATQGAALPTYLVQCLRSLAASELFWINSHLSYYYVLNCITIFCKALRCLRRLLYWNKRFMYVFHSSNLFMFGFYSLYTSSPSLRSYQRRIWL